MQKNTVNLRIKLLLTFIFCFSFNPIIFLTESAKAQDVSYDTFKTFDDWCGNKDLLSKEIRHTIDVLLEKANTSDCKLASKKLLSYRGVNISYSGISNLLPLSSFTSFTKLNISYNQITDIKPLGKLVNMTELAIGFNQISDITPLKNMRDLNRLSARNNQISDVTPLQSLTKLQFLFLNNNKITDISSLRSLINVRIASFGRNPIVNKVCPFINIVNTDPPNNPCGF